MLLYSLKKGIVSAEESELTVPFEVKDIKMWAGKPSTLLITGPEEQFLWTFLLLLFHAGENFFSPRLVNFFHTKKTTPAYCGRRDFPGFQQFAVQSRMKCCGGHSVLAGFLWIFAIAYRDFGWRGIL